MTCSSASRPGWAARWWAPLVLCFGLLSAHAVVNTALFLRHPEPVNTFHDYEANLVKYPLVMRGHAWASDLPIVDLVPTTWPGYGPADVLGATVSNSPGWLNIYQNTAPLHYVVAALLPTLVGPSMLSVRLGQLAVLGVLILAMFGAARRLAGPRAAVTTAVLTALAPVCFEGGRIAVHTVGNMCGVAITLWALLACRGFSRLGWSAVAGVAAVLCTRWGESAGDGVEAAAGIVGPAIVVGIVGLVSVIRRRRWWVLVGMGLALLGLIPLLDETWILHHLLRYIYPEGGVEQVQAEVVPIIDEWRLLQANARNYVDAVFFSLLGPLLSILCMAGAALTVWRLKPRWKSAFLLSSVLISWLVLTLSEKAQDYYGASLIPGLLLLLGVGLSQLRATRVVATAATTAALTLSWLVITHNDLPALRSLSCANTTTEWLTGTPEYCDESESESRLQLWFRRWRGDPRPRVDRRHRLGQWAWSGQGREAFAALPPGALVLVIAPVQDDADVVLFLGQAQRPDVLFQWVDGPTGYTQRIVPQLIAAHQDLYALTFRKGTFDHGGGEPESLPPWLEPVQFLGGFSLVSFSQVRARR